MAVTIRTLAGYICFRISPLGTFAVYRLLYDFDAFDVLVQT
jgi:hypothetical protein